jgi:hypothetical protein
MEEIRIVPSEDGKWNWEHVVDGEVTTGPGFDDRTACIAAGRGEGGAEEIKIIRASGAEEIQSTPPTCRVVLLRVDSSEYGELDAAPGSGGVGQTITLMPASEDMAAVDLEDETRG